MDNRVLPGSGGPFCRSADPAFDRFVDIKDIPPAGRLPPIGDLHRALPDAMFATGFFQRRSHRRRKATSSWWWWTSAQQSPTSPSTRSKVSWDALKGLARVSLAVAHLRSLVARARELKLRCTSRSSTRTTVTETDRHAARTPTVIGINFKVDRGVARSARSASSSARNFEEKISSTDTAHHARLVEPGYSRTTRPPRQKLSADLETLRSWYPSTRVTSISTSTPPGLDRRTNGTSISRSTSPGEITRHRRALHRRPGLPEAEYQALTDRPGETFSRERLTEDQAITDRRQLCRLCDLHNVNAAPKSTRSSAGGAFTVFVDPGSAGLYAPHQRRRHTKTRDEVVRREMRQMEGAGTTRRRSTARGRASTASASSTG